MGDEDRISEAVLRNLRPAILRYCRARLPGSYHAADDVVQEVCLALVAAWPGWRNGAGRRDGAGQRDAERPVAAYAFGIASHKVADALRGAARTAVPVPDLPDVPDDRPGPEETVIAKWEGERVRHVLAQLPAHQRRLLLLRVVSGLTAAEAGEVLGMSAAAVRIAQHRALARMRKLLASEPST
ncbi:MAG TPA: sigma-70 family RNA polymerase sigma factor [Trebonia sp.]|nr:sigma-70 family RNA polymerase sigma factor [Trebonia sp.]